MCSLSSICVDILTGMRYLHEHQLVHRDLKSSNGEGMHSVNTQRLCESVFQICVILSGTIAVLLTANKAASELMTGTTGMTAKVKMLLQTTVCTLEVRLCTIQLLLRSSTCMLLGCKFKKESGWSPFL